MRKHYGSITRMREAAAVLENPDPRELARLGAKPSPDWGTQARLLNREAQRWESERLIDST